MVKTHSVEPSGGRFRGGAEGLEVVQIRNE